MRKSLLFALLMLLRFSVFAEGSDSSKDGKVHCIPVPVFYYTPETRFAFGVGCSFTFKLSQAPGTNYSQLLPIAAYTQNNQIVLYSPFDFYTGHNNYYINGEAGYFKYSYYYWGIGSDRFNEELYEVRYPRIIANAYRHIAGHFYAGIDYNYEKDVMLSTQAGGQLSQGLIIGSTGCTSSGAGLNFLYDSRDSIFFPTKGIYVKVASFFYSPTLGSTQSFQKLSTDFSWYKELSNSFILALNQRNIITSGNVPFNQLALVGGSKQMRGYYYGYYRDNDMTMLQAEARMHIHGPWGLAVFGGSALIGHAGNFPDSMGPVFAEGIGLRYNANRKQHINVRGDLGFGNTIEYYLSVEEAF